MWNQELFEKNIRTKIEEKKFFKLLEQNEFDELWIRLMLNNKWNENHQSKILLKMIYNQIKILG